MTCKECVHYEVCMDYTDLSKSELAQNFLETHLLCDHFKPKSRFVELPCEVGQKIYTKYGYSFKVERIEIFDGKMIFRCGNDGTDDYMAFYDFEIGTEVFLSKEDFENALAERSK